MSPDALNSLFSLCIGFAVAGALASGYQALVQRPAGFGLLQEGVAPKTFAAVPFLVFAAPFIIMRNTLRGDADRTPPFRIRDDGHGAVRVLEPDVRNLRGDDAAGRGIAGLSRFRWPLNNSKLTQQISNIPNAGHSTDLRLRARTSKPFLAKCNWK